MTAWREWHFCLSGKFPSIVIPAQARLHGCRVFGELSRAAELTEDRAMVYPSHPRRPVAGGDDHSAARL